MKVRAFARHEGQGDPAREVPCAVRPGRLSHPELRGLPRPVDTGGVRASDGEHAGASRLESLRSQPGADLGIELSRCRDRSAGTAADSLSPARVRPTGYRGARTRRHRSGRTVEPGGVGRTGAPGGELASRGRRGLTTWTQQRTDETTNERTVEQTNDRTLTPTTQTRRTHWTMCSSSTGTLEGPSTLFLAGRPDLHLPLDPPAGGLQMAHSFEHIPALRDEVVSLFASVPPGVVVDATVGGGGHAAALLESYPALRIVGLDRDAAALEAALARLSVYEERARLVQAPFASLAAILSAPDFGTLSGVLFDLGVSSPQLDLVERGFSFREDGPLDMRMDQTTGMTAAELVNSLPETSLAALFRENGEGR